MNQNQVDIQTQKNTVISNIIAMNKKVYGDSDIFSFNDYNGIPLVELRTMQDVMIKEYNAAVKKDS